MIFNYIKKLINNFCDSIINIILNYFYYRILKIYTNNLDNSRIMHKFSLKKLLFKINNLCITNFLINIFDKINFKNITLIFYSNYNNNPYILFVIDNIKFNLNNVLYIDYKNEDLMTDSVIINNIHEHICIGYKKLSRIIDFITQKQTFIIKQIYFDFYEIRIILHNVKIYKISDTYKIIIDRIIIKYKLKILLLIDNIIFVYDNRLLNILTINNIEIKLNNIIDNISILNKILENIKLNTDSKNEINFKISINSINILFININVYKILLKKTIITGNKSIRIEDLKIYSHKKIVLNVKSLIFDILKNIIYNDQLILNIFNSLGHKLYISLNSFIKKKKIKYNSNNNLFNSFNDSLDNNYIDNIKDINEYIDLNEKSDNIDKLNDNIRINNFYLLDIDNAIYKILTKKTIVNLKNNDKLDISFEILDLIYEKKKINNEIILSSSNFKIRYNNTDILKKIVEEGYDNMILIQYKNKYLDVNIKKIYINIDLNAFDIIKKYTLNNLKYITKIFNSREEYVNKNFFIEHISINSFILNINYFPEKCNYYKIITGDLNKIYNITNYKNIDLCLKSVNIYYPLNLSYIYNKILDDWINDIRNNQILQIIGGTSLKKSISKNTIIMILELLKSLKKNIL